jgi:hypothetical protein
MCTAWSERNAALPQPLTENTVAVSKTADALAMASGAPINLRTEFSVGNMEHGAPKNSLRLLVQHPAYWLPLAKDPTSRPLPQHMLEVH